MLTEDILGMPSTDGSYHRLYSGLNGETVADVLTRTDIDHEFFQRVKTVMARENVNLVPVLIVNDVFHDGHHRVMIAQELDIREMLCTDDYLDHDSFLPDIVVGEEK